MMLKADLDAIDWRIIAALQENGRLSNTELAERVGLSPSPCLRRVKRLERDGYIDGYRAMLRRSLVGFGMTVFVAIKIDGHADASAEAFEQTVTALPEVVACHMISGEMDYLLEVVVSDMEHYQRVLIDKLFALAVVKDVRSNIAIQTLKSAAPLPLEQIGH